MISQEDAVAGAYIQLDAALDAMKRLDLLKGYDMARHKIEHAMEILAQSGFDLPIRQPRKWRSE
jgi:hypothetical protein